MAKAISIIEVVGPPGSGKTALSCALSRRSDKIKVESFPDFRAVKNVPFFARNLVRLSPTLFHLWRHKIGVWLSKRDISLMTILTGWNVILDQQVLDDGKMIVLEEGAICLLAKLFGFGSDLLRERVAEQWWNEMYRKWAEALGLVIVLKSPIQTMIERIHAREQQFEFGDMEIKEAIRHLESIRRAQEHVLLAINAAPHGPKIVQFDTVSYQPDQIAMEISALTLA
jgi:hypothetical protein